jgi:hypothetical protein
MTCRRLEDRTFGAYAHPKVSTALTVSLDPQLPAGGAVLLHARAAALCVLIGETGSAVARFVTPPRARYRHE